MGMRLRYHTIWEVRSLLRHLAFRFNPEPVIGDQFQLVNRIFYHFGKREATTINVEQSGFLANFADGATEEWIINDTIIADNYMGYIALPMSQ